MSGEKNMKYLRVTMPDGSQWDVPADVIAHNRALYWANKMDSKGNYERIFREEFNNTINYDDELMDWAENNMNWDDVKKVAVRAPVSTSVDYQEGWVNGPKQIVEL